jgi:hypothetical protein
MENQITPTPAPEKKNQIITFLQAKRALPTWALILGLLLACGVGHAFAGAADSSAPTTVTTTAAHAGTGGTHTTTAKPPTATPAPKLTTIASYSGSGPKNTANFHVNADQWQIVWTCQPGSFGSGNFIVMVYGADGTPTDPGAVNEICSSSMHDTTIERGSGDFYLSVNADVPWTIQIQAVQ